MLKKQLNQQPSRFLFFYLHLKDVSKFANIFPQEDSSESTSILFIPGYPW